MKEDIRAGVYACPVRSAGDRVEPNRLNEEGWQSVSGAKNEHRPKNQTEYGDNDSERRMKLVVLVAT
jgi:hypothetical protein